MNTSTQNKKGEWVPATPEPYKYMFGICRCYCGKFFINREKYNGHYSYKHILNY